jgi:anaerobic selenocysteine-containing dehydrogenase
VVTANRTTCPFCLNGCESLVTFDYQYRMEYPADAKVNQGRLCPRGNSASIVLDHPQRLGYPLLDGREVSWDRAVDYCREALAAGEGRTAVAYSRGLTEEETSLVWGFARAVKASLLACGYIEPGNCFARPVADVRQASLDDVRNAKAMLLVGDVFATSPVAAGPILEERYADRKNRLIVIDSLRTSLAGFAHLFVKVRPGTEPFALLGVAAALDPRLQLESSQLAEAAGVEPGQIQAAADMLKSGPGFVGSAAGLGRTSMPTLHSYASQLVAARAGAAFKGFAEARVRPGLAEFEELRKGAAEQKLRTLFWFGSLHPLSYAELLPEASKVEFTIATSIFRPAQPLRGLVLPVPSELEKESTGAGYWGPVVRRPLASAYSGCRPVSRILSDLAGVTPVPEPPVKPADAAAVVRLGRAELGRRQPVSGPILVGEKRAIGIGGFYVQEDEVKVGRRDSAVGARADVVLKTGTAERRLRVTRTSDADDGILIVGVNAHENRALFGIGVDAAGAAASGPTGVEVKPAVARRPLAVEQEASV